MAPNSPELPIRKPPAEIALSTTPSIRSFRPLLHLGCTLFPWASPWAVTERPFRPFPISPLMNPLMVKIRLTTSPFHPPLTEIKLKNS